MQDVRDARGQCEVAVVDHSARKAAHDGNGLGMEVSEHGVGAPAPDQADDIGIDAGRQECHGATRAEASRLYIVHFQPTKRDTTRNFPQKIGYHFG